MNSSMSINDRCKAISSYAIYTLIASYWYRVAFEGLPFSTMPEQLPAKRRFAYERAKWYDAQAGAAFRSLDNHEVDCAQAHDRYHLFYKCWREEGYNARYVLDLAQQAGV